MTLVNERLGSQETGLLRVGDVQVLSDEVAHDRKGHEYTVRRVRVGDESDANPELKTLYKNQGDQFEQMLKDHKEWPATTVEDGVVNVSENNIPAQWLYVNADGSPTQVQEWASHFPTAIALEPLQRLEEGGKWLKAGGPDEKSLELFTNMVDAIGLRSRARIYEKQITGYAERSGVDKLEIISLGSGAAVPNIQATEKLEEIGKAAHWKFFDFNPNALMFAQQLVAEKGFNFSTFDYGPERFNEVSGNLEPTGRFYQRAYETPDESVDIVDALGLWEYLKPKEAQQFAKKLFEKVKPGGSMIVSNMLPSRPQRELNQRAVGWPGLYLRSDTDLLDIVTTAGIDSKNVTMTHAEDGVYVVMEIQKP